MNDVVRTLAGVLALGILLGVILDILTRVVWEWFKERIIGVVKEETVRYLDSIFKKKVGEKK